MVVALGALAGAPGAPAAVLGAELQATLAQGGAGPVPVIVSLAGRVTPEAYAGRPEALLRALRATARRTQPAVMARLGAPARRFWITNTLTAELRPAAIRRLARDPAVRRVDLDVRIVLEAAPTLFTPAQPDGLGPTVRAEALALPLDVIGARAVWQQFGVTGRGVLLGSLDTGVDATRVDLAAKIAGFRDFVGGRSAPYDDSGHGTNTVGTMVGGDVAGQPIGVAPGARVLVAKGLGTGGRGTASTIIAAAQWLANPDGNPATPDAPVAVNSSWTGGAATDPWFRQVVRTWISLGIVPVFAAGNNGPTAGSVRAPGGYPEALSVGALDEAQAVSDFSSRGPIVWTNPDGTGPAAGTVLLKPDLTAPGVSLVSAAGSGYATYSGTSMSTPHVTGVVALLKEARPALTGAEIMDLLRRTATDLGAPGADPAYGAGRVDALAAVSAVVAAPTPPPPSAAPPPPAPAPRRPPIPPPFRPTPGVPAGPLKPQLQGVRAPVRILRSRRSLVVTGRLTAAARVQAALVPLKGNPRLPAAAIEASELAGRFRLEVPLRSVLAGRYRLVVRTLGLAGGAVGRPVTLPVTVVPAFRAPARATPAR